MLTSPPDLCPDCRRLSESVLSSLSVDLTPRRDLFYAETHLYPDAGSHPACKLSTDDVDRLIASADTDRERRRAARARLGARTKRPWL